MHEMYKDILSRIAEPPKWYDQNGVPRYDDFNPEMCPNIYSHYVGLFEIACQHCGLKFRVEMHADIFGRDLRHPPSHWHYGDPPAHGCVGDSMNCEDLAVLKFWHKPNNFDWERAPQFEGAIDPD